MGCGCDVKEKDNNTPKNKPKAINYEENYKQNIQQNVNQNKENIQQNEQQITERKEEEELKIKQDEEKAKKEEELKKKMQEQSEIDTEDFSEENYPLFQSDFYETHIQNIKKFLIEKDKDGTVKTHKIYIVLNYNEKKTKIIEIEKEEKAENKKKHLVQHIIKECSLEKVKPNLEKYNKIYGIDTKELLKLPKGTDSFIKAQIINGKITKIHYKYEKSNQKLSMFKYEGTLMSYSNSSSNMSGLSPEDVVEEYNKNKSQFLDNSTETISLIDQTGYNVNDFTEFQQEGLKMHNKYRADHHVPELELNKELCEIAQKYAEELAKKNIMQHSHAKFKGIASMGENLYWCSGFKPTGDMGVTSWYDEIHDYDFKTGKTKNGKAVGHFTQVVWKESKYVGMGIGNVGNSYYVVANYYPAGNLVGTEVQNVLPK